MKFANPFVSGQETVLTIVPLFLGLLQTVIGDKALFYQTSPCPSWNRAITVDGAVLRSGNETQGDCRITFQVARPDKQRFLLRFESGDIQECHDRLTIFDADEIRDSSRLEELSCRSRVDKTRSFYTSNAGGYVTIRYNTYNKGPFPASDFRLVLTAVSKYTGSGSCGYRCANNQCISPSLRCDSDHINHCGDNSDELNCPGRTEARQFLTASFRNTAAPPTSRHITHLPALALTLVLFHSLNFFPQTFSFHQTHSV